HPLPDRRDHVRGVPRTPLRPAAPPQAHGHARLLRQEERARVLRLLRGEAGAGFRVRGRTATARATREEERITATARAMREEERKTATARARTRRSRLHPGDPVK